MSGYAQFGPLVVETDVDVAVIETLKVWLPTYLRQVELERDLTAGFLKRPKPSSFANTLEDDEFKDHPFPAIIVTTAQTAGRPTKDGNGNHYAAWNVVVSSITRGRTPPETRALAALYSGCVRRLLVQQEALGGLAGAIDWVASNVAPVADVTGSGRYLAAGINQFSVYIDEVVQSGVGPLEPEPDDSPYPPSDPDDPEPYNPLALVTLVTTEITAK